MEQDADSQEAEDNLLLQISAQIQGQLAHGRFPFSLHNDPSSSPPSLEWQKQKGVPMMLFP